MLLVPLPVGRAFNFRNKPSNYEHLSCSMCIDFLFSTQAKSRKNTGKLYTMGEVVRLNPCPYILSAFEKFQSIFFAQSAWHKFTR